MTAWLRRLTTAVARYGVAGVLRNLLQDARKVGASAIRRLRQDAYLLALVVLGRHFRGVGIRRLTDAGRGYRVAGMLVGGYAVRGLALLKDDGRCWLASADVGDDAISLISLTQPGNPRARILFARGSAPIGVAVGPSGTKGPGLLAVNFNFDTMHTSCDQTSLWWLDDIDVLADALRRETAVAASEVMSPLFSRDGHWGFRGVASSRFGDGEWRIALTDRDTGQLHVARCQEDGGLLSDIRFECTRLSDAAGSSLEPVGVTILPGTPTRYCVSLRKGAALLICGGDDADGLKILQELPLPGPSRSSVACGAVLGRGRQDLAVALWGGDPEELEQAHQGLLVVFPDLGNGEYGPPIHLDAGINATDVVCGDFDGDGLDELAVLNYGVGLCEERLGEQGGVTLYRLGDTGLEAIADIRVPHPRIGLAADIDGDGRDELIVSLFFARRLAVIGYEE